MENDVAAKQKGIKVSTSSVLQTLEHFCNEKNIPLTKIDFELISHKTEVVSHNEEGEQELEIVDTISEEMWLNPDISIRQSYEIFLHLAHPNPDFALNIALGGNKSLTSVVALIKPNSKIIVDEHIRERLIRELNNKKLKLGMLINVYDSQMYSEIDNFIAYLKSGQPFDKDFKIDIFHAPEFVPTKNDHLELNYKSNAEGAIKPGVVSADRGKILITYTKPKEGKPSRDAKGRYLSVPEPVISSSGDIKTGDNIERVENDKEVIFKSLKNGFVMYENGILDVKEELAVHDVSLKTGYIDVGMDGGAKLDITDDNPETEAIGDNMRVRAAIVNVQGSIGANANVEANELHVGGQTHKTSKTISKNAFIKNHKGFLEADEAEIETLEGGEVIAKKVKIKTAIGGVVKCDECIIDLLGSNNVIEATRKIEIHSPHGGENRLSVVAAANAGDMKKLDALQSKIATLKNEIEEKEEAIAADLKEIESASASVPQMKEKIAEERQKNSPLANVLLLKLKQLSSKVEQTKIAEKEIAEKKEDLSNLLNETDLLQYKVLDAKITAGGKWEGYNFVSFKLIYPPREFTYKIMEGSKVREITLKRISDADYEVFTV